MFNILVNAIDPSYSASLKAVLEVGIQILEVLFNVLLGVVIYFILKRIIYKLLHVSKFKMSERKSNTLTSIFVNVAKYAIGFIVICQILPIFGVNVASIIAVAGVGSIAIGFAAQNLVKDFITGLIILAEDQYGVGDVIKAGGCVGTVEFLGMRVTRIRSENGDLHIIPNGSIGIVTNMSRDYQNATVDISIAYEADSDYVIGILKKEMEKTKNKYDTIKSVPEVLGLTELQGGTVKIKIVAQCIPGTQDMIERELRSIIKKLLMKENILI